MNDARAKSFNHVSADLVLLGGILTEAAQLHGDNWEAVERHIREKIADLPAEQQERLAEEMKRILRFSGPPEDQQTH